MARRARRSGLASTRRGLYLAQRTLGDLDAARRGRLPVRLVRRGLTRAIMRALTGR